jgi:hypothetical protein
VPRENESLLTRHSKMSTPAAATPRCTYLEPLEVQLTRGYFLIALLPLPRQRSTGPGRPPNRCSYTPPQRTHSHSARQRCGTGRNAECSCATCRIGREEVRVQRTGREGARASGLHGTHEHAGWGARGRSTLRMREAEQRQLDREIEARRRQALFLRRHRAKRAIWLGSRATFGA